MNDAYCTLRVAHEGHGVVTVAIDAPPMNLIGPEIVRDLVGLLSELESVATARVMVPPHRGGGWSSQRAGTRKPILSPGVGSVVRGNRRVSRAGSGSVSPSVGAQRPQRLERSSRVAARLSGVDQQMLSTGVGDVEPIAMEIQIANLWVAHMDDPHPITHVCACP